LASTERFEAGGGLDEEEQGLGIGHARPRGRDELARTAAFTFSSTGR
jgi:hypothetical protein